MLGLGIEALLWALTGWGAREMVIGKGPAAGGAGQPNQPQPQQAPQGWAPAYGPPPGAFSRPPPHALPGMPHMAPTPPQQRFAPQAQAPRAPTGPVVLDAHLPPEGERAVWQCIGDTDEVRAERFAVTLAQRGYPVAAGIVSLHVHMIRQAKAIIAQQQAQVPAPPPTAGPPAPASPSPEEIEGQKAILDAMRANGIKTEPAKEAHPSPSTEKTP